MVVVVTVVRLRAVARGAYRVIDYHDTHIFYTGKDTTPQYSTAYSTSDTVRTLSRVWRLIHVRGIHSNCDRSCPPVYSPSPRDHA